MRGNFGHSYDFCGCLWLQGEVEQMRLERQVETSQGGRGTSPRSQGSIAWAVRRHLRIVKGGAALWSCHRTLLAVLPSLVLLCFLFLSSPRLIICLILNFFPWSTFCFPVSSHLLEDLHVYFSWLWAPRLDWLIVPALGSSSHSISPPCSPANHSPGKRESSTGFAHSFSLRYWNVSGLLFLWISMTQIHH